VSVAGATYLRWLSESAKRLYAADSPAELARAVIDTVAVHFRASDSGLEELAYDLCRYSVHGAETARPFPQRFEACIHDHPIIPRILNGNCSGVMHLLSYAPPRIWERTDQYQGLARAMGWGDQLAILSLGKSTVASCCLWRETPYSPREREQAELLHAHFDIAWRRVAVPLSAQRGPATAWIEVSAVAAGFRLNPESAQRTLLRAYFPEWRGGPTPPDAVARWLVTGVARLRAAPPAAPMLLRVECARGTLALRLFPAVHGDSAFRIKLIERPAVPDFFRLTAEGLTARECEVLHWVAAGKRDAEIAAILSCSSGTVSKHAERVRAKLGVGSRTDAVAQALLRLHGATPSSFS